MFLQNGVSRFFRDNFFSYGKFICLWESLDCMFFSDTSTYDSLTHKYYAPIPVVYVFGQATSQHE